MHQLLRVQRISASYIRTINIKLEYTVYYIQRNPKAVGLEQVERLKEVTGVFGDVRMEAESAFPGTFSDFEAERLMSGVELHQIPTHKFEDLGTADIDVDCALSYVVLQHHILNVIFERSGGKY